MTMSSLGIATDHVTHDLGRAVIAIDPDVVERVAFERPDSAAAGLRNDVAEFRSTFDVANAECEIFAAGFVEGIRQSAMIVAVSESPQPEVGLAGGEGVGVEQNAFVATVPVCPNDKWMFASVLVSRAIGVCAVGCRHR